MKTFKKSEFLKELKVNYGSISKLKSYLKSIAKEQYGCYFSTVKLYGCEVVYTSNSNCFASYIVNIPMCGMTDQLALDSKSITKAGLIRGCGKYHL